jgi:hypothetical protein
MLPCRPFPLDASLHRLDGMPWDNMGGHGQQGQLPPPRDFPCLIPTRDCQTACKPGSVRTGGAGRPFLWDAPRGAPRATNPDGGAGMPLRQAGAAVPIRSCSRWGLPCRPCCQGRGALLPPRFALARGVPCGTLRGRFVFCGTFPGVAPAGGYPAPYSRGARTFLCRVPGSGRPAVWQRQRWAPSRSGVKAPASVQSCGRPPPMAP